jgi:hypothetical protein
VLELNPTGGTWSVKLADFLNATGIRAIHLGANLDELVENPFVGADNLNTFTQTGDNFITSGNMIAKDIDGAITLLIVANTGASVTITDMDVIGDGVRNIFTNKGLVTTVTIADAIEIAARAFEGSDKLVTVNLPSSLVTIGQWAFANTVIGSITLNEGLETIGAYAFYNADLKSIVIPASMLTLGLKAFAANANLVEVELMRTDADGITEMPDGSAFGYEPGQAPTDFEHEEVNDGLEIFVQDQESEDAYKEATGWIAHEHRIMQGGEVQGEFIFRPINP